MITANKIFEELKKDILTGQLKSGQRLVESELCKKYNVSRTPIRDVILKLETCGLIENKPNRGARVRALTSQELADIFQLRKLYESQATLWAINRITNKEFEDLKEIFEFMEFYTMKKDLAKMLKINETFHHKIHLATHNEMLIRSLNQYQSLLYHSYSPTKNIDDIESYLNELLEEHRKIYTAFEEKNPEQGYLAMERHLLNSEARRSKNNK